MTAAVAKLGIKLSAGSAARTTGRPPMSDGEAFATVASAVDAGLTLIDTDSRTPDVERMLGVVAPRSAGLRLVIKTTPSCDDADVLERSARASLRRVDRRQAYALICSRGSDLLGPHGGTLWARMQRLRDAGLIERIGIAACVCDNPLELAKRFKPDIMQLPVSLIDQRLVADGTLEAVATLGVEVHLRSVSLESLPLLAGRDAPAELTADLAGVSRLRRELAQAGADPLHAMLGFALSQTQASAVIVTVASPSELRAVLSAATVAPPVLDWPALALGPNCALGPRRCAAAA